MRNSAVSMSGMFTYWHEGLNQWSWRHDFISYDKNIVEYIAGETNVGRGEQGEK